MKDRIMVKNTFFTMLSKGVALLGYMLLDIYIARMLDVNTYAEWAFFYSIVSMLFLIGWLGINVSSKVYISKQSSEESKKKGYSIAFRLRIVSSILIALVIFLFSFIICRVYNFSDKYQNINNMFILCAFMVFFNSITEFYKEISVGLERFKSLFIFTFCENIGYIFGVVICLLLYVNPVSIPIGYIIGGLFVFLVGICFGKKDLLVKVKEKEEIKDTLQKILRYALPIAIMGIGGVILLEMDVFMLGLMSTNEQLSAYSIAKQWCSKASHVNLALITGVMTTFSVLNRTNIAEKMKKFKKISILNVMVTVIVMLVMILILPYMLLFLYGEEYREVIPVLKMLTFYYGLYGISTFYATFLDFQNKAKIRSLYYISIIIINLILNFLLIPQYGAKGAAASTIISLIPYTVFVFVESNKCLRYYMKEQ